MKVLFIAQSAGGVERYIKSLLQYINRKDYEILMVCSFDYKKEEASLYADYFVNIDMQRSINLLKDFNAILKIRRIIKREKPDIIYLHSSKAGALGRIADLGIKNKVIYNPHGWAFCMDCSRLKKMIYSMIERLLAPKADRIIAISQCEKNRALKSHICPSDKIQVILNGIDEREYLNSTKDVFTLRKEMGIPHNAYVIGFVGRICNNKSPDIFVEAASIIQKKIPNAFFLMVGDGPDRELITNRIEQIGLKDSFLITGWVKQPYDYMRCFNQGVLLTRWEGFGLVLAEYMVAGVPIIATDIDSVPELVQNGVNGLLVEVNNPFSTAEASIQIYSDPVLSCSLVKNGRCIVEKFKVERVAREHELLFNTLTNKNNK